MTVRDVTSTPLPPLKLAEEFAASRLPVPLEADGERLSIFVDMTFLRQGRALAGVFTFQSGSPFSDTERVRLSTVLGDRLGGKNLNTPDTIPTSTTTTAPAKKLVASPTTTAGKAGAQVRFRDPSGVTLEHPRAGRPSAAATGNPWCSSSTPTPVCPSAATSTSC